MKNLALLASTIGVALLLGAPAHATAPTKVAVAGEWTRCVASSVGTTFNIVNGQGAQATCFALARKCTGDPNATVTYYNSGAVIVDAPYVRCTAF
jgi:hypothetical protein